MNKKKDTDGPTKSRQQAALHGLNRYEVGDSCNVLGFPSINTSILDTNTLIRFG